MEVNLAGIMKVQGVLACAVFAHDDACLEFAAVEPIFEPIMLLAAVHAAEESFDVFRTMDRLTDASSLTCELEHGRFVYRNLGATRLAVMTSSSVNVAMLDVAIGVAVLKLAQVDGRRPLPSHGSSSAEHAVPTLARPAYGTSGAVSMASASVTPPPAMRRHPVTTPPASPPSPVRAQATGPSPLGTSPTTGSGVSPGPLAYEDWRSEELLANGARVAGAIGPSVMQHMLRTLVRYLGGHAKAVIVEELASLGATPATASPAIFTDLIYNVASRIPDPSVHDEFVKLVLGDR